MTRDDIIRMAWQICRCSHEPKKEWVGLTDDEIKNSMQGHNTQVDFARAIEAKLKEKNS